MKKYLNIYLLWAGVFIILPLVLILFYSFNGTGSIAFENFSFSLSNYKRFFEPLYLKMLGITLLISFLATIGCLLIGYPVAYIISKMDETIASSLIFVFIMPMWINLLLRTYGWITLLGRNGVLNRFLASFGSGPLGIMYTPTAVVLGMVYEFLPFMVIQIYNALKKVDKNLIDAALDLGADRKTIFRKVIFPLSLPGVYTGVIMVFIPAISTFVVSNLLGGQKVYMIGNLIDQQFTFTGDWGFGAATAIILMLILFLALFIQRKFGRELEGDIV
ncbi:MULTISPECIES: ABC transporter permease [Anaerococcus]|jgi:polyamine ABC transporter, permease protein|uniref:ABC transporter permease n=1 Tax=Anaerococcus octavius TaxID=54007 RepID=A0A2I1MAP2_9FIRM|nr:MULTISPECIES: ABC transporter permease [Anaerococcus]MBS6105550.1 ABC transporter permease [Anaerococcus sp.]MDU3176580.1 ABC transporter permease [Anaerococcus sp.]PKZ17213.1 ABC transporter permease [Anaerococcus octavius]